MRAMSAMFRGALLVLGAAAGGCGEAPVPVSVEGAPPRTERAPDPHARRATESYAGVVRLRGALAETREAFLFVSVMPAGLDRPGCSTKIALAEVPAPDSADRDANGAAGELAVPFALDGCVLAEGAVELQVRFDLDGYVETREEGSLVRRHPVERASRSIDVALEPGA